MKILCIGAHPDDLELSMGGTILKLVNLKHEVNIVDLSNGEPTPFGSIETRKKESQNASLLMGISRIELDFSNRYILDSVEGRKKIASVIREFKPEIIFTHFKFDTHPDHTQCCKLVEGARFYAKLSNSDIQGEPHFPEKLIYFFPNHIKLNIHPSFCVDIDEYFEKKMDLLRCYESQFLKNGNGKVIEDCRIANRYFGLRIGKYTAEPFYLNESLDINYFSKLFGNNNLL